MARLELNNSDTKKTTVASVSAMEPFRTVGYEGVDWYIKVYAPPYFNNSSIFKEKALRNQVLVLCIPLGTLSFIDAAQEAVVSKSATLSIK